MFSLRIVKDYLLHRFKVKNRHGLHSPFVYRLVDEVIYDFRAKNVYLDLERVRKDLKQSNRSTKTDQLLYRLCAGLKPKSIGMLGPVPPITSLYLNKAVPYSKIYTSANELPGDFDFALIDYSNGQQVFREFEYCLPKVNDETMIMINNIYRNAETKQAWATIKANPNVTVTIDLFWMGLVFFRKGQVREDFWIRF